MRTATIRIRKVDDALAAARTGFIAACTTQKYQGDFFDFESPAALFRILTPRRWALIECLQNSGPLGVRALARALGRDVKRVHEDTVALSETGMLEKTPDGKLCVPFAEIRADFVMKSAA